MKYTPFGMNAGKPWSTQLDLFRDVAPADYMSAPPKGAAPAVASKPAPAIDADAEFDALLAAAGLKAAFAPSQIERTLAHPQYYTTEGCGTRSRLRGFPMQTFERRVYLIHPGLDSEPWMDDVRKALGYRPEYHECVAARRYRGEDWHAMDLCTKTDWKELIDTLHLTNPEAVANAVVWALGRSVRDPSAIDLKTARLLLDAAGVPEMGMADDDILIDAVLDRDGRRGAALFVNVRDRLHAFERGLVRWNRSRVEVVKKMAAA